MEAIINYGEVDQMTFLEKIKYVAHFISKIVLYVLFLMILLIFLVFAVYFLDMFYNLKTGSNVPPLFNAYVIVSPSMVPTIRVNDAIVVKREREEDLKKGDIVTFSSNDPRYSGLTVTHRIVGVQTSQNGKVLYRTKGDANNVEDSSLVEYGDIYGKVVFRIPSIGYIHSLLINSYGWLLLVVVPCLGVIIYDIIKLYRNIHGIFKKDDNSKDKGKKENNKKDKKIEDIDIEII